MDDQRLLRLLMAGPQTPAALAHALGTPLAQVDAALLALAGAGVALERAGAAFFLPYVPDLHDAANIRQRLAPAAQGLLEGLDVVWQVDSTNSELLRRSPPQHGIAVLLAEQQAAGRGRHGRVWASPLASHVYLSLACRFHGGLAAMAGLSLAVGVMVAEALRGAGVPGAALKWPNDLLVDGRKLGGILVESRGKARADGLAVVGIGVNVHGDRAGHPVIDQPWTSLDRHLPGPVRRDTVVQALLQVLLPGLAGFEAQGLPGYLPRFAALDALAGRPVWVHQDGVRLPARAIGLAADGALRVVDQNGERSLYAGDVSVRMQ